MGNRGPIRTPPNATKGHGPMPPMHLRSLCSSRTGATDYVALRCELESPMEPVLQGCGTVRAARLPTPHNENATSHPTINSMKRLTPKFSIRYLLYFTSTFTLTTPPALTVRYFFLHNLSGHGDQWETPKKTATARAELKLNFTYSIDTFLLLDIRSKRVILNLFCTASA